MGLTAKEESGNYQIVSAGAHRACCIGIYDLGTQHNATWNKEIHKVMLTWELGDEFIDTDEGQKPMVISQQFTLSLSEKANLRKSLESWRGRPFTPEELAGFDMKKVLGAACMLSVIHNQKDGKTYANISAIMAMPKGMPPFKPVNPLRFFSMEEDRVLPDDMPNWIKKIIENSVEFRLGTDEQQAEETVPAMTDELEAF